MVSKTKVRFRFKVFKTHCINNARSFSFACRRTNCWNSLPNHVRSAQSLYVMFYFFRATISAYCLPGCPSVTPIQFL